MLNENGFTKANLALIGELEDLFLLYENATYLYGEEFAKNKDLRPNGFPSFDKLRNNSYIKLLKSYYNSHMYLFTNDLESFRIKDNDIMYRLLPIYYQKDSKTPLRIIIRNIRFEKFLKMIKNYAAEEIQKFKRQEGKFCSVEAVHALIDARINGMIKAHEAEYLDVPFEPEYLELVIYKSLDTISCKLKDHKVITKNEVIPLVEDTSKKVVLPIHICKDCGKKFIGEQSFAVLTEQYGILFCKTRNDINDNNCGFYTFADESKLHSLGYNVIEGEMTTTERQLLLKRLLDKGLITPFEASRDIERALKLFRYRKGFNLAVKKWEDDIRYIKQYLKTSEED